LYIIVNILILLRHAPTPYYRAYHVQNHGEHHVENHGENHVENHGEHHVENHGEHHVENHGEHHVGYPGGYHGGYHHSKRAAEGEAVPIVYFGYDHPAYG